MDIYFDPDDKDQLDRLKKCNVCGEEKKIREFTRSTKRRRKIADHCMKCLVRVNLERYYEKNMDQFKANKHKYYLSKKK